MFRGALGVKGVLGAGTRRGRTAATRWPADQPLVSALVGDGARLGVQTLADVQEVSGSLADAVSQARGKYLALVPAECACDPRLLEKALLVLEVSPELGFVCAVPDGSATPLNTVEALGLCRQEPQRTFAMVRRAALVDVAVPGDVEIVSLLRLVHGAAWEGAALREPPGVLPAGESAVCAGASKDRARRGVLRLLPEALGVGLREAWWDHLRSQREGVSTELADFGRGLRTTRPDREAVLWLLPWLRAGGAEAVLLNLLAGLGDRYHFLLCLTIDIEHDWRDRFRDLGCEIYVLPELLPRRTWAPFLERLVTAKRPSTVVNAHSQYGYDVAEQLRQRLPQVRFLDLLHNDSELGFIGHAARHDAAFDGHIVVSERIRDTLVSHYRVAADRVHTIANGIDVHGRFDPEGMQQSNGGDFVVGYVGRLSDEKDPLLFVQAAKTLVSRGERCRFVIAGDGPLAARVRERISVHGLSDRFELLGHVENVPAVLARLDLCMLTSKVEGCPLVALEALAMGRPVVSTSVGNLAEVLGPPRGRAVSGRDPAGLADAVSEELKTSRDPARRAAIRKEIVATYGLAAMADAYAALFNCASTATNR